MTREPCAVPVLPHTTQEDVPLAKVPGSAQEVGIPLRREPPLMLWWIIGVHLAWAFGLHFEPESLTRAIALVGLEWLFEVGLTADAVAAALALFATMAAVGLASESWVAAHLRPRLAMVFLAVTVLPQYFLVLLAFTSDMAIIFDPDYTTASGTAVGSWVLIAILCPVVWGALLHTAQILLRAELAVRGFPPWPPRGEKGRWVALWKPD
jgi:hypothetical protein